MNLIPGSIADKYEFYNFNSALEILTQSYPEEFAELVQTLERFEIRLDDILEKGGNESNIPKKLSELLRPLEWREMEISGDLVVRLLEGKKRKEVYREFALKEFISGHKIDYVKGNVAIDMEWNSKDQTFDRDLLAMRTYFDCGIIEVGVIVTRSQELNDVFREVTDRSGKPLMAKYGASTTWMGKLEYRLKSRRNGGCPILAVGIRQPCIEGY